MRRFSRLLTAVVLCLVPAAGQGAVTRHVYDAAGAPVRVSLPNGAFVAYGYDGETGLLSEAQDETGSRLRYGYDPFGNLVEAARYDAAGRQTRLERFDYGGPVPGRLFRTIHPDGSFETYGYDAAGNRNRVTDANLRTTAREHDRFRRLKRVVGPDGAVSAYGYDRHGNLAEATDGEGRVTTFRHDDMGRLVETVSPDSGVTRYAYDAAGNRIARLDAGGALTSYGYDGAGRRIRVDRPGIFEDEVTVYAAGRPVHRTDAAGMSARVYDIGGRVAAETRFIAGRSYTTSYRYDAAGVLEEMTYPDGRTVTYRLSSGRVSGVVTEKRGHAVVVAAEVSHLPFGPPTGWTLGNGLRVTRKVDRRHLPSRIVAPGVLDRACTRDAVGNVTAVTDRLDPSRSRTFGYDVQNRLVAAGGPWGEIAVAYDRAGNRTSFARNGVTERYHYDPGSNRLNRAGRRLFDTGPAGRITAADDRRLDYDAAGRLSRVSADNAVLAAYATNALGQRVQKTTPDGTVIYHYDIYGRLIGESDDRGDFTRTYIHLGPECIAAVDTRMEAGLDNALKHIRGASGNPGGGLAKALHTLQVLGGLRPDPAVFYFVNDHLGTPVTVVNADGNTVWDGEYLPFGSVENRASGFTHNLRFPGQHFDPETGLHYNWHRYYDPTLGRYLTPDPIGIAGGMNLYAYALNNPLDKIDPYGLSPLEDDIWPKNGTMFPIWFEEKAYNESKAFLDITVKSSTCIAICGIKFAVGDIGQRILYGQLKRHAMNSIAKLAALKAVDRTFSYYSIYGLIRCVVRCDCL